MANLTIAEFADKLNEILPLISKKFLKQLTKEFYKGEITLPQFVILDILSRQCEARMTDLAKLMGVSTAAMTGVVDRLVRGGYVARTSDPRDRRIVKIRPTAKGIGLARKITAKRRGMIIDVFGKVSQRDREDYLRVLTNIRDILTKEKEV